MSQATTARRGNGARWIPIGRAIAGLTALLVAWIHLLHPRLGLTRLLLYLQVGTVYDPRPPVFVLISLVIFVGLGLGLTRQRRGPLYVGGIILMSGLLLAYVAWHSVLDHGAFWPHIEPPPATDAHLGLLRSMFLHLQTDPIVALSKLGETSTLILLVILLWFEQRPPWG